MITALQKLLQHRGYLSGLIIDEAESLPSSSAYQSRFGSLLRAYALVGYLSQHHHDILTEFQKLTENETAAA